MPVPFDIFLIRTQWRRSRDTRPCVVLEPPEGGRVRVSLVSSQTDLYDDRRDFLIRDDHPDLRSTGLDRTSNAYGEFVRIETAALGRKIGNLAGELGIEFAKWLG